MVYWLRRVLALLVILALLMALRWIFFGRGGSTPDAAAAPASSSSPVSGTTPKPSKSAAPTPVASESASSSDGRRTCANSDIEVTASTDAASYPVGSTPKLHLKIQNTSGSSCYREIGAAMNELSIKSGGFHVWSSDDCNSGGSKNSTLMKPSESFSVTVTWPGILSAQGCPSNQPVAKPGSYELYGRNGTLTSAPAVFSLTAP